MEMAFSDVPFLARGISMEIELGIAAIRGTNPLNDGGPNLEVETSRAWVWPSVLVVLALVSACPASPARAVEVNGSFRAWIGETDAAGLENDEEDLAFRLALTQDLSPWLTLFGSYRSTGYRTTFQLAPDFERTSEQPEIGLAYDRSRLNARLVFSDRAIRTTDEALNLDIQTFLASLDWRPSRGPRLGFRYQDSTSTTDAVLVGRDTDSRSFNLGADYSKANWSARYSFDLTEIENNSTGLRLEQTRHEVRAGYFESLLDDRWSFSLDARYADVRQTQDAATGVAVALPVAVTQGLFAIDATPSLGALESAPSLIDGDRTLAAAPGIEIGGANTFRNIGVDLGISRPVSELEISVDAPSGPVVWQVWQSPDNSSWFQLGGVTSVFDAGLLRYTVRFPETNARFVKAVNVSVNPVLEAAVTEVRALRATTQLERSEGDGSEYWLRFQTSLRPTDRIELSVGANLRRDQDLVATDLRRDYDERGLSAQLRSDLSDTLELRIGYRVTELEESVQPVLERREEVATVALDWRPVEAVGVLLTAQEREGTDGSTLLTTGDSLTLQAVTEIFPDLVLNSTLGVADTVDTLFDFTQETRYVVESFEARPNDRWLLSGSLSRYEYDSAGRVVVTSRTSARLGASWFATPFLSFNGEWVEGEDDLGSTTTQRLGWQWAPGPKLSLAASYYDTESSVGSGTANFSFDGSYRMNRWLRFWLALNEAESLITTQDATKTTALRLGVNAIF